MIRRLLIGVHCVLFLTTSLFLLQPRILLAQQTVLQVCIIANPGDSCGSGVGNNGGEGSASSGSNSGTSGGGGAVGNTTPPFAFSPNFGEVYFSGVAYPGSSVTLERDGQFLSKTVAGNDAKFQFNISNVTPGTFIYGIWSQDSRGVTSVTNSFSVAVTPGVGTVISGIYLPPTIDTDKSVVKQGDPITILGLSAPNSQISILVHSSQELVKTTSSDKNGLWMYVLDTIDLEYGSHDASARWKDTSGTSPLSAAAAFTVGNANVLKRAQTTLPADINGDGKVNAIDFSILAYWYKRPNSPANVDLDHDGKVDTRDFSILAYYWGR
jgi:hypothetical protein